MDFILFLEALCLGIVSGLIPGLHSNTVISILSTFGIPAEELGIMIVVIMAAHILTSFIPSIFFGIPESNTFISVLPGQRLVREGRGITALKAVLFSGLFAALLSIILFYPSLHIFPFLYSIIRPHLGYILVILSAILLLRTKNPFLSLCVFLLSGILGYFSLNSDIYDPFLPLFSGMFAMGAILNYKKSTIPEQKDEKLDLKFLKFSFLGVIGGMFADLLPGVSSPSQVAAFFTIFLPVNTLGYLASLSSISISEAIFSFSTQMSIEKSRIGATVWLSRFMPVEENILLVLVFFLLSVAATTFIIVSLRKYIGKIAGFDFSTMNVLIAAYLISIVFILDGITGLGIFALGSVLGFFTIRMGIERTNLMGGVILPTILTLFKIFIL